MKDPIKFWLSRTHNEHIKEMMHLLTKINTKCYQLLNYDSMREEVQEEVREQLYFDMLHLGWLKEVEELKETFRGEENEKE